MGDTYCNDCRADCDRGDKHPAWTCYCTSTCTALSYPPTDGAA